MYAKLIDDVIRRKHFLEKSRRKKGIDEKCYLFFFFTRQTVGMKGMLLIKLRLSKTRITTILTINDEIHPSL